MPEWLKTKLREGGADNPYAVMNAAGIDKGDSKKKVSAKMSRFQRRRRRRGATGGQAAATLALLLALLLPATARAQDKTAHLAIGFDVASTTINYTQMNGERGDPWSAPEYVAIPIDTVGSSTTVSAVTASSNPFADLAVGDVLYVRKDNSVTDSVWITAKATDDQVTVDTAVDWSAGYNFEWLDLTTGTDSAAGWISVSGFKRVQMTVLYTAGDLGGLDVVWECREASPFAVAVQVYPGPSDDCGYGTLNTNVCTYSTVGDSKSVELTENLYSHCRVGLAYRTSDAGVREAVHVIVTVGQ
jgi:hypothetical protein